MSHPERLKSASNSPPAAPQGDYCMFLMVVMRKISNFSHHHHQKHVKGDFSIV
jgi:hypothetical protein